MKYLLDTHIWLWLDLSPDLIPGHFMKVLKNPSNQLYLSSISCLEIVIKNTQGKLALRSSPQLLFKDFVSNYGAIPLDFSHQHAALWGELPMLHKDPFDRALIVQAQAEHIQFVTVDSQLRPYGSEIMIL